MLGLLIKPLGRLHPKANDYIQLMRLDRPIGTYLLLWPTLWALWLAAEGMPGTANLVIFILGVILMRAAGCVINDYADLWNLTFRLLDPSKFFISQQAPLLRKLFF